MPDPNNTWYEQASASLRKFFEFASGKNLPGVPDAPTRNPLGGGGLAPAPKNTGFNLGKLFGFGNKPNTARRYFDQERLKFQGQLSAAQARGDASAIQMYTTQIAQMDKEGADAFQARRLREMAEIGQIKANQAR